MIAGAAVVVAGAVAFSGLGFGIASADEQSPIDASVAVPSGMIDAKAFSNPPANAKPATRWWWGPQFGSGPQGNLTEAQTRQQLDEIAKAGFGRVELAYGKDYWATPQQRKNLEVALDEGKKLGLQMDTTLGAGWPLSTPNTSAGTGLNLQELQYGRTDVAAGQTFNGAVPGPYDDPTNTRQGRLVAVTAAKVVTDGPAVTTVNTPPASSTILDQDSLVDLTSQASNGQISWTAPAGGGHWILFGFWQRDSKKEAHDHFNHEAIEHAIDYVKREQFSQKALDDFAKVGYSIFEDSLEIDAEGLYWDDAMASQFASRRGYDMTKYLPLMYQQGMNHYWVPETRPVGDFDFADGSGERLRNDYYELITDLYVDEHLNPLGDMAKQMGVKYRTQPAFGVDLNTIRSARDVTERGGLADDESFNVGDVVPYSLEDAPGTWRFGLDHHRAVASGSHQGGSSEITSELGAQNGTYTETLADYKGIMDKEWAGGTTRPMLHGTTYQTDSAQWPGDTTFGPIVGESWNSRTFPQWNSFKPLNAYWGRGAMILQTGTPKTDVAVYQQDAFLGSAAQPGRPENMKPLYDAKSMEEHGFSVEYVDPDGILDKAAGSATPTLYPNGPDYKALVIDQRALPADVAEAILAHAKAGLDVVFVGAVPNADTSYRDRATNDARVQAAVSQMLTLPNVTVVADQASTYAGLAKVGASPAAQWSAPAQVYTQRRSTDAADYYYLYNATGSPVSFTAQFTGEGQPYEYSLWDGRISQIANFTNDSGRTNVPISLGARGTSVIAVSRQKPTDVHVTGTNASRVYRRSDGSLEFQMDASVSRGGAPQGLSYTLSDGTQETGKTLASTTDPTLGTWNLKVTQWGSAGKTQVFDAPAALGDWQSIPALKEVSGTGTYHASFDLDAGQVASAVGMRLDLGQANNSTVVVRINGQQVAPDCVTGRSWDVSSLLKAGTNTIDVDIATTLRNQVTHEQRSGDLQSYGLAGPVALISYARLVVPTSQDGGAGVLQPSNGPQQQRPSDPNHRQDGRNKQAKGALSRTGASVAAVAVAVLVLALAGCSVVVMRKRAMKR